MQMRVEPSFSVFRSKDSSRWRPTQRPNLKLCRPRDPYPGELGFIKENVLADLFLLVGNPLDGLSLVVDPDINLVVSTQDLQEQP